MLCYFNVICMVRIIVYYPLWVVPSRHCRICFEVIVKKQRLAPCYVIMIKLSKNYYCGQDVHKLECSSFIYIIRLEHCFTEVVSVALCHAGFTIALFIGSCYSSFCVRKLQMQHYVH